MEKADTDIMTEEICSLLDRHKYKALREYMSGINVVDMARIVEELPSDKAVIAFRTLHKNTGAEVFAELDGDTQQRIINAITDKELSYIVEELNVDDAVDMLEEMPANMVLRVLINSSSETRLLINKFLRYPENSAGSIMTAEFTELDGDMTIEEAIAHIRAVGENKETIYTCYVADKYRRLSGEITVKDMLLAQDTKKVREIMKADAISILTTADREEAVMLMSKYYLTSLPVVDTEDRLVGIITVDDALDVMQEETTEDFEKMAAMAPSEKPYLRTGVMQTAKNRLPWLLALMVSSMLTGLILTHFGPVYAVLPMLITFMPMLTGTGGNAGSQSSTMIIRGMALGEIKPSDVLAVLKKEAGISIIVGIILGLLNFIRLGITNPGSTGIAVVVSVSQMGAIVLAKTIGGVLPMAAKAVGIDPAIMAAPMITTIVDCVTLILYFTIAKLALI